jgi:hypothetical protein
VTKGDDSPLRGTFLAGQQEFTTKSTKGDENICKNVFVLFVSFVVKLIFGCG